MNYFTKTPWWLKKIFPKRVWHVDTNEKNIYLTFDDGPHPEATPFVLDELKKYDARATFFCVGKNVQTYHAVYERILDEGHSVGNHTQHHLNGYKTPNDKYLSDIREAARYIHSELFRPPFGRMRSSQAKMLKDHNIVMWDVLSGDFDHSIPKEKCVKGVLSKAKNGSIIVFHDSEKAWERMSYCLPLVLEHFSSSGYAFLAISSGKPVIPFIKS